MAKETTTATAAAAKETVASETVASETVKDTSPKLIELEEKKETSERAMKERWIAAKKQLAKDLESDEFQTELSDSLKGSKMVETGEKDEKGKPVSVRVFTDYLIEKEIAAEVLNIKKAIESERAKVESDKKIAIGEAAIEKRAVKLALFDMAKFKVENLRSERGFDPANTSDEYKGAVIAENDSYIEFTAAQTELHNLFLGSVKLPTKPKDEIVKSGEGSTLRDGSIKKAIVKAFTDVWDLNPTPENYAAAKKAADAVKPDNVGQVYNALSEYYGEAFKGMNPKSRG